MLGSLREVRMTKKHFDGDVRCPQGFLPGCVQTYVERCHELKQR